MRGQKKQTLPSQVSSPAASCTVSKRRIGPRGDKDKTCCVSLLRVHTAPHRTPTVESINQSVNDATTAKATPSATASRRMARHIACVAVHRTMQHEKEKSCRPLHVHAPASPVPPALNEGSKIASSATHPSWEKSHSTAQYSTYLHARHGWANSRPRWRKSLRSGSCTLHESGLQRRKSAERRSSANVVCGRRILGECDWVRRLGFPGPVESMEKWRTPVAFPACFLCGSERVERVAPAAAQGSLAVDARLPV